MIGEFALYKLRSWVFLGAWELIAHFVDRLLYDLDLVLIQHAGKEKKGEGSGEEAEVEDRH